jgi:hypothetical protein
MPKGAKNKKKTKKPGPHDQLKWETAKELGLDNDLARSGEDLTVREAGKIGGQMVKKLIKAGEKAISDERGKGPDPGEPVSPAISDDHY